MRKKIIITTCSLAMLSLFVWLSSPDFGDASSHREAPLIAADPLADNTDLYAFRSPDNPDMVTVIANYIPLELPEGGPNYSTFGEKIRYEIHIKNQTSVGLLGSAKDDISYRFTFSQVNEDPTTFFNIRLGQNLKTTYTAEKSTDGGASWSTIVTDGIVPPNKIGPRSTLFANGLAGDNYNDLVTPAITTASSGEMVFCGPRDDPFFVDLGGVFDLGQTRSQFGGDPGDPNNARDAVAGFNTHAIVLQIPINMLQKDGLSANAADGPLDPNFVIGVWASASRPQMTILRTDGGKPDVSGPWVQVSRLGMPLTNEVIIPIGEKDRWNAVTPYSVEEQSFVQYFANPELQIYMQDGGDPGNPTVGLGDLVPALADLRVANMSYPALGTIPGYPAPGLDFRIGKDGAFAVTAIPGIDLSGTAFAVPTGPAQTGLGTALVGAGDPRRVDIFPIFYFGVPNAIPYQLATGKTGGPLSPGKPFIHNFLPITEDNGVLYGGDMLRLNMATPPTPRGTNEYTVNARMGLIRAAVLGLTDPQYNATTDVQEIPHMDGFPNGRRLEDDVTTIELQAVGGLVLAAVGLPFDDAVQGDYSDLLSTSLLAELNYNAGPTVNDVPLQSQFPYLSDPHEGFSYVKKLTAASVPTGISSRGLGIGVPKAFSLLQNYPNPFNPATTISYEIKNAANVTLKVYDIMGKEIATLVDGKVSAGTHTVTWNPSDAATGMYFAKIFSGEKSETIKMMFVK